MFQVLVWFGFNHSINSNQVKKVCYGQTQGFILVLLEGKEIENWSVLGPVGWSGACVPAAPPSRYIYGTISARTGRAMKTQAIKSLAIWD